LLTEDVMDGARRQAALTGATSGVLAGIAAGIVMIGVFVALAVARGGDIWPALKGPAVALLHERAFAPGFDLPAVGLGMLIHIALSAAFGAAFGFAVFGLSRATTLVAGAAFGLVVYALMFGVVLRLLGASPVLSGVSAPMIAAVHAFYGLCIATFFAPFQRPALARRGAGTPWWSSPALPASTGATRVQLD
jgi:hypothetical protein